MKTPIFHCAAALLVAGCGIAAADGACGCVTAASGGAVPPPPLPLPSWALHPTAAASSWRRRCRCVLGAA